MHVRDKRRHQRRTADRSAAAPSRCGPSCRRTQATCARAGAARARATPTRHRRRSAGGRRSTRRGAGRGHRRNWTRTAARRATRTRRSPRSTPAQGTDGSYPAGYLSTDAPPWDLFNVGAPGPTGVWWGLVWSDAITLPGIDDCTRSTPITSPRTGTGWPAPRTTRTCRPTPRSGRAGTRRLRGRQGEAEPGRGADESGPGRDQGHRRSAHVGVGGRRRATPRSTIEICTQPQYGDICVNLKAQAESFDDLDERSRRDRVRRTARPTPTASSARRTRPAPATRRAASTFGSPGAWNLVIDTTWQRADRLRPAAPSHSASGAGHRDRRHRERPGGPGRQQLTAGFPTGLRRRRRRAARAPPTHRRSGTDRRRALSLRVALRRTSLPT